MKYLFVLLFGLAASEVAEAAQRFFGLRRPIREESVASSSANFGTFGPQQTGQIGMYINVPTDCNTVYEAIIDRLNDCKNGVFNGDPNLDHGCLVQINLTPQEHGCVYDANGNVRRTLSSERLAFEDSSGGALFDETIKVKMDEKLEAIMAGLDIPEQPRRPTRREIVEFLLEMLEEEEE